MHDRQNYSENDNLAHMMSITILYKVGPGLVQTDTYISFAEKDIDIKLNPNRKIIIINKSTETNMCVHAQLVNHGVSSSLLQKLKSDLGEFYKFPSEERMKYKMRPGVVEGYGHSPIWLEDQKLDWGDRFYMTTNPIRTFKEAASITRAPSSTKVLSSSSSSSFSSHWRFPYSSHWQQKIIIIIIINIVGSIFQTLAIHHFQT